jgi:uncharacterized protein YbjQ (UPF0145 family)
MTDLVTLETNLNTMITAVGSLNDDCQDLFDEVTTLKGGVTQQISDAVETSENAALEPLISMAANVAKLANIIVVNLTPET